MSSFVELRKTIAVVLRWWWLILLATTLAGLSGFVISQRQTRIYEAETTIIVGRSIQAADVDRNDITTGERLALTYAEIARRQPILQQTIDELELSLSWRTLRSRVRAKTVAETQLLEISVEAESPENAVLIADKIAEIIISLSPTALQSETQDENEAFVRDRIATLQENVREGQVRIEALEEAMLSAQSAAQLEALQNEIDTVEDLIASWESNYSRLLETVKDDSSPNYLAVIEPAQASTSPIRPRVSLSTMLAGMVGFGLALAAIFLIEYLDDTIRTTSDLNQSLGLNVLGAIMQMKGRHYQDKLIIAQPPFSPVSESYRMIRSNIQFLASEREHRMFMITSSVAAEGKTTTVANLGIAMAQNGYNTVIVDADLRRPTLHGIFQASGKVGLTELLNRPDLDVMDHLLTTGVERLRLLPSGIVPRNPSELLGSKRLIQLLAELRESADVVILDTPPILTCADAAILSQRVDGVVMVVKAGKTRRDVVKQAIFYLQQVGANIIGAVLNDVASRRDVYYYPQYEPFFQPTELTRIIR